MQAKCKIDSGLYDEVIFTAVVEYVAKKEIASYHHKRQFAVAVLEEIGNAAR